jgi:hypothetical protein
MTSIKKGRENGKFYYWSSSTKNRRGRKNVKIPWKVDYEVSFEEKDWRIATGIPGVLSGTI